MARRGEARTGMARQGQAALSLARQVNHGLSEMISDSIHRIAASIG